MRREDDLWDNRLQSLYNCLHNFGMLYHWSPKDVLGLTTHVRQRMHLRLKDHVEQSAKKEGPPPSV